MNHENETRSRKEKQVNRQKEGAAPRQGTRSKAPARSRKPRPSVAELRDDDEFTSKLKLVATGIIGAIIMYALMWLAAAY